MTVGGGGQIEACAVVLDILEGIIAVGKSFLTDTIGEKHKTASVLIFKEHIPEDKLDKFYSDRVKNNFWFQLEIQKYRNDIFEQIGQLLKRVVFNPNAAPMVIIWDRAIGDLAFVEINRQDGGMTNEQMEEWKKNSRTPSMSNLGSTITQFHALLDKNLLSIEMPRKVVFNFLYDKPKRCYRRLHQRGNLSEQGVPLDYLVKLDSMHKILEMNIKNAHQSLNEAERQKSIIRTSKFAEYAVFRVHMEDILHESGVLKDTAIRA